VIGARRITADAKPADDAAVLVQRNAAAERDASAAHFDVRVRVETCGIERLGLRDTPE
jgi:hypothetical protein